MKNNETKDIIGFIVKVFILSALLSSVIKYGGPLLPFVAPFTAQLNGLVTAIVVLPSILIGGALLLVLQRSPHKS